MPTDSLPSPAWAASLPAERVPQVLAQLAALQTALAARLAAAPAPATDDILVDAPECARRLGVPESHIRTLQRAGAIPSVRVGAKYIRFRIADVEAALNVVVD